MSLSTIVVALNAQTLRRVQLRPHDEAEHVGALAPVSASTS